MADALRSVPTTVATSAARTRCRVASAEVAGASHAMAVSRPDEVAESIREAVGGSGS
ncbi:hypothetical protein GA0074704_4148 [Micromonospora siamensis]|uniref:Alpha/beta hydrolase family protein n=1 Tax=Micromonospora siamensis TaxID=299152 RepID=A0A1C5J6G7_9ACTN|nr:hypothetical protein GA0074704_4148 [Micromonospora siamensis]